MYEDEEVWAAVPGWEGYEVSTWGRVRSYWVRGNRHRPRTLGDDPRLLKVEQNLKGKGLRKGPALGRVLLYDAKTLKQSSRSVTSLIALAHDSFRCIGKNGCGKLFELNQRVKSSRGANYCKTCDALASQQWRLKNPERAKEVGLKRMYGLTLEEYKAMLWEQNGCCRI